MICRHCHTTKVSRPRGLCWCCYYRHRDQYPSTSKYARRGAGAFLLRSKPPLCPTDAPPGSLEKVAVLSERAALGQDLWHPHDATFAGPQLVGQAG